MQLSKQFIIGQKLYHAIEWYDPDDQSDDKIKTFFIADATILNLE